MPDTATLSDMVADLEKYSGKAKKNIVMGAGRAAEDNLELIWEKI